MVEFEKEIEVLSEFLIKINSMNLLIRFIGFNLSFVLGENILTTTHSFDIMTMSMKKRSN